MKTIFADSFETGFFPYQGISELECPEGWAPDWETEGGRARPEYKPKWRGSGATEIRTGDWAASIHVRYAKHQGVLYRQFEAEYGKAHLASVWCMGVTGDGGKAGHGMRIGVDPTGRLDFRGDTVRWGDWYSQYMDEWQDRLWWRLPVEFVAENDRVTVFLWSSNDYARDAFAHFDDFLLEVEGDADQPQPQPSDAIAVYLERIAEATEDMSDTLADMAARRTQSIWSRMFARG